MDGRAMAAWAGIRRQAGADGGRVLSLILGFDADRAARAVAPGRTRSRAVLTRLGTPGVNHIFLAPSLQPGRTAVKGVFFDKKNTGKPCRINSMRAKIAWSALCRHSDHASLAPTKLISAKPKNTLVNYRPAAFLI